MKNKLIAIKGKTMYWAKKNAPELLLGTALVTGTACVITSSRATLKAASIKDYFEEDLNMVKVCEGDEEAAKKEIKSLYMKYAFDLMKTYAVPAGLYAATVAAVFASYKTQKNRQIALSTALAGMTTAYNQLLNKLKNGAEHGLTCKEVMEGYEVVDRVDEETGEVISTKVKGDPVKAITTVRFDRYSTAWVTDKFQNKCTLQSVENWANDMLRLQGFIFLNDVYDRLGIPKTKSGQIFGWRKDGIGYVDFQVVDCATLDNCTYDDNAFDLTFNIDGDILSDFKDDVDPDACLE